MLPEGTHRGKALRWAYFCEGCRDHGREFGSYSKGATVKFATEKCPDLVFAFTVPVVTQSAVRGPQGVWQEAYCLKGETALTWLWKGADEKRHVLKAGCGALLTGGAVRGSGNQA